MASLFLALHAARRRARFMALAGLAISAAYAPLATAAEAPLTVEDAVRRALDGQPLLAGVAAQAQAARETAVAAAALPDPALFAGVQDLPIDGEDAYSFSDDTDTQLFVGIEQAFPTPAKRRLRGLEQTREGERLDLEHTRLVHVVRRDVSLAWLAVWEASRAVDLVRAQRDASALEADAVGVAQEASQASLAEVLGAEIGRERLTDALSAREQTLIRARSALGRWIGTESARPVARDLPVAGCDDGLSALLATLPRHPEVEAFDARVAGARVAEDLAAAERRPDWRVEVGYGHLRASPDMVMMRVGVDLPLFPGGRQDRNVASARLQTRAAEAERDDAMRRLAAEAERACAEADQLDRRLAHFDKALLPRAKAAVDATLAAWRQDRGELADVLAARRGALELALERLAIEAARAAQGIEIEYLAADAGAL